MIITTIVLLDKARVYVPTAILSFSMVPYATASLVIGSASWILPREWTRAVDNFLYTMYLRTTLFVFENISSVKIHLYGDIKRLKSGKESALVISNHQSDSDWAAIAMLAARQSPAGFEYGLRFVVKSVIHMVPLFGWYILQHGYVYVRRFGDFSPDPVVAQLKYLANLGEPFWLHLFPEGTRFTWKRPQLIDQSRAFCQSNHIRVLRHVLAPRTKAFSLAATQLRDALDCVYDVTLAYSCTGPHKKSLSGYAPNMLEFCGTTDPYELHMHIKCIPIGELPTDTSGQRDWLMKRFEQKDAMLEEFYATGKFPDADDEFIIEPKKPAYRNFLPFLCFSGAITVLPIVSERVRNIYMLTAVASPLLIAWLHLRKQV